jgi:hypothetical protein
VSVRLEFTMKSFNLYETKELVKGTNQFLVIDFITPEAKIFTPKLDMGVLNKSSLIERWVEFTEEAIQLDSDAHKWLENGISLGRLETFNLPREPHSYVVIA